jgi:hypothetical protein
LPKHEKNKLMALVMTTTEHTGQMKRAAGHSNNVLVKNGVTRDDEPLPSSSSAAAGYKPFPALFPL